MSNPTPLAGRTAVVTGASSGIGRAIAEALGAAGAHVFLCGRTAAAMEASALEIEAAGGQASVVSADLRDPARVQALVDAADVANAVLYAVTQPPNVNIADIVIRPPKQIDL